MLPLNDEQRILVEENMGLVGKVIKDCLQNPSAQGCYSERENMLSSLCGSSFFVYGGLLYVFEA